MIYFNTYKYMYFLRALYLMGLGVLVEFANSYFRKYNNQRSYGR